jgi:tetrahydromethanopterin S-methyltransferase subunit C
MQLPDTRTLLNGLALVIAAAMGVVLIFQAVPAANAQIVGVIVGGIIGFLTGAAPSKGPPANPQS